MNNTTTVRMRVTRSGEQYLGECLEYPVMTHGKSLEELAANMEKAIGLFLGEEDRDDDDLTEDAVVAIRIELPGEKGVPGPYSGY